MITNIKFEQKCIHLDARKEFGEKLKIVSSLHSEIE